MKNVYLGSNFIATLFMLVVLSLFLNAEPLFVGKSGLSAGVDNTLNVKFGEMNLGNVIWRKVAINANSIRGENVLNNMHVFALVNAKTDKLFLFKDDKNSLVQHSMLATINFKKSAHVPNIIRNSGNMNIIGENNNILKVNYLVTADKTLNIMNFKNARIAIIDNTKARILFTNDNKNIILYQSVTINFDHDNIMGIKSFKLKADAGSNEVDNNGTTAKILLNPSNVKKMLRAYVVSNEVDNNGTTAKILLNPSNVGKMLQAYALKKIFGPEQILLNPSNVEKMLQAYAIKKIFGPEDNSQFFPIMSNSIATASLFGLGVNDNKTGATHLIELGFNNNSYTRV